MFQKCKYFCGKAYLNVINNVVFEEKCNFFAKIFAYLKEKAVLLHAKSQKYLYRGAQIVSITFKILRL